MVGGGGRGKTEGEGEEEEGGKDSLANKMEPFYHLAQHMSIKQERAVDQLWFIRKEKSFSMNKKHLSKTLVIYSFSIAISTC